jgi:hypothetical protein
MPDVTEGAGLVRQWVTRCSMSGMDVPPEARHPTAHRWWVPGTRLIERSPDVTPSRSLNFHDRPSHRAIIPRPEGPVGDWPTAHTSDADSSTPLQRSRSAPSPVVDTLRHPADAHCCAPNPNDHTDAREDAVTPNRLVLNDEGASVHLAGVANAVPANAAPMSAHSVATENDRLSQVATMTIVLT